MGDKVSSHVKQNLPQTLLKFPGNNDFADKPHNY